MISEKSYVLLKLTKRAQQSRTIHGTSPTYRKKTHNIREISSHCAVRIDPLVPQITTRMLYITGSAFLSSFRICDWFSCFRQAITLKFLKNQKNLVRLHESCHFVMQNGIFEKLFCNPKLQHCNQNKK